MICDPCRKGGRLNRIGNDKSMAKSGYVTGAAEWHAKCEAPTTCPCQHRTGQHMQSRRDS